MDRAVYEFEPKFGKSDIFVPDTIIDGWETDHFVIRAACVRGYAHRYDGIPRQDQISLSAFDGSDAIVIAVADGVSESPQSSIGAALACRYATNWCRNRIESGSSSDATAWDEESWNDLMRNAAWGLINYAHVNLGEAIDPLRTEQLLGTTLTVAIVTPTVDGNADVNAIQAGDSDIWILRDRRYDAITPHALMETSADHISSTAVIGLPRLAEDMRPSHAVLCPDEVLLAGSDGFGSALGEGTGLIGDLFSSELSTVPNQLKMAHMLDFSRDLFDDDRSLIAVWRKDSTEVPTQGE
ncbi:protein phosphatase 2C domain-containing protein [Streptomyces paradoxus]|uniref:protein phosphatase 2C domain-containing protein n=1 Tax=Streptomyces paradoxus TaxID=66375 RepID=UPI003628DB86